MNAASSSTTVRPSASTLTASQLATSRAALTQELAEALDLLARLRAEVAAGLESRRSTTTDESEDPEGSSLAFEGAQLSAMVQQTDRHASEITEAIARIDRGTYGVCLECETAIGAGRLEARPASAHCINCAA